jgi:SSS family solute:Na+ symporter
MLFIWLPSVFLGVAANAAKDVPAIASKLEARAALAALPGANPPNASNPSNVSRLRSQAAGDDVILRLVEGYAPLWLASLLGACVMAAVMSSDSQILALSTMFTEDVFAFYGGKSRFGEAVQVATGRAFVVVITLVAYMVALQVPQSIFDIATQYAFAGYSALAPLLVAAIFWRRSTRWGAFASTAWTALAVAAVAWIQQTIPPPAPGAAVAVWTVAGVDVVTRAAQGALVLGFLPVVPMTIVSALLMVIVSRLTPGALPSQAALDRYFDRRS